MVGRVFTIAPASDNPAASAWDDELRALALAEELAKVTGGRWLVWGNGTAINVADGGPKKDWGNIKDQL